MPLTFSTHFLLHFLKPVPGQMVTNHGGRREYIIGKLNHDAYQIFSKSVYSLRQPLGVSFLGDTCFKKC